LVKKSGGKIVKKGTIGQRPNKWRGCRFFYKSPKEYGSWGVLKARSGILWGVRKGWSTATHPQASRVFSTNTKKKKQSLGGKPSSFVILGFPLEDHEEIQMRTLVRGEEDVGEISGFAILSLTTAGAGEPRCNQKRIEKGQKKGSGYTWGEKNACVGTVILVGHDIFS